MNTVSSAVDYPRVTDIIKVILPPNFFEFADPAKGKHVHTALNYYDKACLDIETLDETLKLYIKAYEKFQSKYWYGIHSIEPQLINHELRLQGTPDRICFIDDKPYVLDFKTSGHHSWHIIQLVAYRMLVMAEKHYIALAKNESWGIANLYLTEKNYRLVRYTAKEILDAERRFKAGLEIFWYRNGGIL